jgi:hypothetical protein
MLSYREELVSIHSAPSAFSALTLSNAALKACSCFAASGTCAFQRPYLIKYCFEGGNN